MKQEVEMKKIKIELTQDELVDVIVGLKDRKQMYFRLAKEFDDYGDKARNTEQLIQSLIKML